MDDNTLRISVGLRLGTAIGVPHLCHCCGKEVTAFGIHGLSCKSSSGRHYRHAAINEIIHQSLSTAKTTSRLEPQGLLRTDGKRPDGMTITPWSTGKPLVQGSIFYNVPLSEIFRCELEPFNAREESSIVLMSVADCHLARKALAH